MKWHRRGIITHVRYDQKDARPKVWCRYDIQKLRGQEGFGFVALRKRRQTPVAKTALKCYDGLSMSSPQKDNSVQIIQEWLDEKAYSSSKILIDQDGKSFLIIDDKKNFLPEEISLIYKQL